MGYYTEYRFEVLNNAGYEDGELIDALRESSEDAFDALDNDGNTHQDTKWYEWKEDLVKFSEHYPEAVFCLHGVGENSDDIWRAFIQNGTVEMQTADIVFEDPPAWAQRLSGSHS
jgi:hypothetical protein